MKKYRSLALICALALIITGCKAQSAGSDPSGAASAPTAEASIPTAEASAPTVEAIDDININVDVTSAAHTTAATTTAATTTEATTTEATTITVPEIADPVELQSYTIGNDLAQFTFDAPEGLEFEEQSSSIAQQVMFESYAYYSDEGRENGYTIGAVRVDFDYTLGQPQELLDYLGYPGDFNIKTEFFSETTESGTAYDLVVLELYTDENMQEYSSVGMVGFYPMQNGVLFFGYEIHSQENYDYYYSTQKQTLNSLVISENAYPQPDEELSGELQTVVCEEYNCTFPVLKEFEYWEDDDAATMWSGMTADDMNAVVAGFEADVYYKDIYEEFTYETDTQQGYTVLYSDYMQTYDGKEFGFAELTFPDFTCLYALYNVDGGTYIISYNFMDECDAETKGLIIESFKGFKITAPDVEASDAFCKVSVENCSFRVLNGFTYFCDGIESEEIIWQGIHDNNKDHFFAYHCTYHSYKKELADQKYYKEQTDSAFSIEYDTTYNGTEFTILCQTLYEDEEQGFVKFIAIRAMYPAEDGFYALEYCLDENNSQQFIDLIHESFKSFEISE